MALAKKNKSKRAAQSKKLYLTLLLGVISIALILSFGIYFYTKEKNALHASFAGIIGHARVWVAENSAHKSQKAKPVIIKKPVEPQIHYEFYTSLPSMQIPHPAKREDPKKNSVVSNAQELEQDVSAHIKQGSKKPSV